MTAHFSQETTQSEQSVATMQTDADDAWGVAAPFGERQRIPQRLRMSRRIPQALKMLVEMSFIIFLFYANLLMGEYTNSHLGRERGLLWALRDVFTANNFAIALIAAFVGYFVFEYLRKLV